jgi:hypothetical protein
MNNIKEVGELPEKYRKHFDVSRESPSYLEVWVCSGTSPTARFPLGEFVCPKEVKNKFGGENSPRKILSLTNHRVLARKKSFVR